MDSPHPHRISRRTVIASLAAGLAPIARSLRAESIVAAWNRFEVELPHGEDTEKRPIVTAVAIDPLAHHLAIAGDDHSIRIWDMVERRFVNSLLGHADIVRSLDYSDDARLLVSGGNDGVSIVWNPNSGTAIRKHFQPHPITKLSFDRQGKRIASIGFQCPLRLVDISTGAELHTLSCPSVDMRAMSVSSDGQHIAAGGRNGVVRVWNYESGQVVHEFKAHRQRIRAIEFSPDGRRLASCSDDRTLRVCDLDGAAAVVFRKLGGKVMSLAFCGADQIATGGSDNSIRIWDLPNQQQSVELPGLDGSVTSLAFADSTLISAGYDTKVMIWTRKANVAGDDTNRPRFLGTRPGATRR